MEEQESVSVVADDCSTVKARKKVIVFLVLVVAFSAIVVTLQMCIPWGTRLVFVTWSPLVGDALKMWSVGIAGLLTLLITGGSIQELGFRVSSARYCVIAAAVPLFYCSLIYVPVWLLGIGRFRGGEHLLMLFFLAPYHLPLTMIFAAGEEIGWRGVLVPNLARAAGFGAAALAPGAIWAIWHWPDILLFGFKSEIGTSYSIVFFSISLVGLGVFLSWVRLISNSVWPPIAFHTAHNLFLWKVFEPATLNDRFTEYFTTEFGAGLSAAAVMIGCLCWMRRTATLEILV